MPIESGSLLARFLKLEKKSSLSAIDPNEIIDSQQDEVVPQPQQIIRRMIRSILTAGVPESFTSQPKVNINKKDNTSE